MRAYWELTKAGFRRYSSYHAALVSSIFTNSIFGLVRASLLLTAIATAGHSIGGYSARQAATYVWLGQGLIGALDIWGSSVIIGDRIKSGDIAVDFSRPLSIVGAAHATNFGRAAFELLPRLLPMLIIGGIFTDLWFPTQVMPYLLGIISLPLAAALCYTFYFCLALTALWTIENRGFIVVGMVIQQILCGFVVPVSWFPDWLYHIAHFSPFPSMFQTTTDIFTGQIAGAQAAQAVSAQALWLLVLTIFTVVVLERGRTKVVIQGG